MKIAICSDIHDQVRHLKIALNFLETKVDALVVAGDLCSPFMIGLLGENFSKPVHIVFGNNDGDLFRMTGQAQKFSQIHLHGEFMEQEFAAKKWAMNHYPEIARPMAASGLYDVIVYGHNHQYHITEADETLLINPGTLMGYNPVQDQEIAPTFVIYDSEAQEILSFQIQGSEVTEF